MPFNQPDHHGVHSARMTIVGCDGGRITFRGDAGEASFDDEKLPKTFTRRVGQVVKCTMYKAGDKLMCMGLEDVA